jgi:hypothetical protein
MTVLEQNDGKTYRAMTIEVPGDFVNPCPSSCSLHTFGAMTAASQRLSARSRQGIATGGLPVRDLRRAELRSVA